MDSREIYRNVMSNHLKSKFKVLNYKILFHSVSFKNKLDVNKGIKNTCVFCSKVIDEINHIFYECHEIKKIITYSISFFNINLFNYKNMILHYNLNRSQIVIVSRIKWVIWQVYRNEIERNQSMITL